MALKGFSRDNVEIGKNIKYWRKQCKLTQKELGDLIGKTESSVQKYEAGVTEIPRSILEKIANELDVHVLDLLDGYGITEWEQTRDNAAESYLKAIGVVIDNVSLKADEAVIKYKGYGYKVPFEKAIVEDLLDDFEDVAINLVKKIIEKYSYDSFKL